MTRYPLEPDAEEMRRLIDGAARRIIEHIESLPSQPASNVEGATEFARSFNSAGPGYVAYVPGGGIFHAAIADLIADAVNRYVGVFAAAPALVQLEANVVRWFCEIVGFRKGSGGVLTTGGSLAMLIAIITARKSIVGDDFARATLYASDQIHHAFQKAASLAGFPKGNVREIESDESFRARVDLLEEAIARDRAAAHESDAEPGGCDADRRKRRNRGHRRRRRSQSPRPPRAAGVDVVPRRRRVRRVLHAYGARSRSDARDRARRFDRPRSA